MSEERLPARFDQDLRLMQIIVGALVMGVVSFGAVAFLAAGNGDPPDQLIVASMGAVFAAAALIIREIVGRTIMSNARRNIARGTWQPPSQSRNSTTQHDGVAEQLVHLYRTKLIIRAAILEGASFLNLIAFMTDGQIWSIGIAVVLTAFNLATMPSRQGLLDWIRRQMELIEFQPNTET